MGALGPVSHWMPEDDLLLKSAVEAGASLESLAKGAVRFSRRFTTVELQERWHSLLYDPIISAESSSHMIKLERSTPNLPAKFIFNRKANSKETKNLLGKRNVQTIRACYNELRKKMRIEPFVKVEDLNFLVGPNDANFLGNVEGLFGNGMLEDPLLSNFEFEQSHLDIIHNAFPEILADNPIDDGFNTRFHNPVEDNLQNEEVTNEVPHNDLAVTENGFGVDEQKIISSSSHLGNSCSEFEGNHVFNSPIPDCGPSPLFENLEYLSQIPGTAEKSGEVNPDSALHDEVHGDSKIMGTLEYDPKMQMLSAGESRDQMAGTGSYLADLSNSLLNDEDCMELDGKELSDKSYYDGLSSLLVNPPNDAGVNQENTTNATDISAETSVPPDSLNDVSGGDNKISGSDVLAAPAYDPHPEIVNGVICCVLNTEDPHIPCNDDIYPLSSDRPSLSSSRARKNSEACNLDPSSIRDFSVKMAKGNSGTSVLPGQTVRLQGDLKTSRPGLIGKCDTKFPFPRNEGLSQVNLAYTASACGTSVTTMSKDMNSEIFLQNDSCDDKHEQEGPVMFQKQHEPNIDAEVEVNTAKLDPDEDLIESDDELPCYSDIEAMILDMDLDLDDQDLFQLEVSKYEHQDIKRAIIRLEQGAHSYMQREIASHGAFAVLYGRYSKHFIKKPEVLLGRATGEYPVDIDLGRAGSKTQVSRRQAIISLNNDGSFSIRNLGKQSIAVNDKELDHGESVKLASNCLIEIRGMPLIFESNDSCIRRFLDGKINDRSCKKTKFSVR